MGKATMMPVSAISFAARMPKPMARAGRRAERHAGVSPHVRAEARAAVGDEGHLGGTAVVVQRAQRRADLGDEQPVPQPGERVAHLPGRVHVRDLEDEHAPVERMRPDLVVQRHAVRHTLEGAADRLQDLARGGPDDARDRDRALQAAEHRASDAFPRRVLLHRGGEGVGVLGQLRERERDEALRDAGLDGGRLDILQAIRRGGRRALVGGRGIGAGHDDRVRARGARLALEPRRRLGLQLRGTAPDERRLVLRQHAMAAAAHHHRLARRDRALDRAAQFLGELLARREALGRVLREAAVDDRGEGARHVRRHADERRRRARHVRDEDRRGGVALERHAAAEQEVAHAAERVEVRAAVERAALHLLRAHVVGGPHHVPFGGEARRALGARDPEVGDERAVGAALDHDVLRLHVAVDHAARMGVGERPRDLAQVAHRLGGRERAAIAHALREVLAVHEPHHEEGEGPPLVGAMDVDDVRMRELAGGAGLAQEAAADLRVRGDVRREDLERDLAVEPDVARAVDDAHAAAPELGLELELAGEGVGKACEARVGSDGHGRRGI
jgi:hypothetical protein